MENKFKESFVEKYSSVQYDEVEALIEFALSCNAYKDELIQGCKWSISQDVEKHNKLQYTHYITLTKKDEDVTLEYENGINNGTVLLDYDLYGEYMVPSSKIVNVISDIKLDLEKCKQMYLIKTGKELTAMQLKQLLYLFDNNKASMLKMYKNQNYDNYVTGGGTFKTDKCYKEKKESFNNRGLYWNVLYKEIEADLTFI